VDNLFIHNTPTCVGFSHIQYSIEAITPEDFIERLFQTIYKIHVIFHSNFEEQSETLNESRLPGMTKSQLKHLFNIYIEHKTCGAAVSWAIDRAT